MFPFLKPRSRRRAPHRLLTKQVTKVLRSRAKATRAAVRQGSRAARHTTKAVKVAKAEQISRAPGRFIEVDGVKVHYIVRGKADPWSWFMATGRWPRIS